VLVQVMSPILSVGPSVYRPVWCTVEKRLIGSGCRLGSGSVWKVDDFLMVEWDPPKGGSGQCNVTYRKNVALRCGCSVSPVVIGLICSRHCTESSTRSTRVHLCVGRGTATRLFSSALGFVFYVLNTTLVNKTVN